ncbi:hypothetical protein JM93_00855 [Roseibium hamelinense]|uniref:Uncharacterized protein n=1 Tax=Roseibium hamelinense TaxID=150831 RepID=A0A562TK62_9HYPH|nr:hypothetical protein [Roseibium hamelinense]MTI42675.1 hypothetical protein [Roseibium hamelinense]TWI93300.1 hypothetical protein JM93_00855 [Roseibium hamelinense]
MTRTAEPLPLLNAADFATSLSDRVMRAMLQNGATGPLASCDNRNVITLHSSGPGTAPRAAAGEAFAKAGSGAGAGAGCVPGTGSGAGFGAVADVLPDTAPDTASDTAPKQQNDTRGSAGPSNGAA